MGLGTMMTGGLGGCGASNRNREKDDFYPTPPECVRALLKAEEDWLHGGCSIWEPACGDGTMMRVLAEGLPGAEIIGSDLVDRGAGEVGDFLKEKVCRAPIVITNPPFSLAAEFIRKAVELEVEYLALLLKATFWHPARSAKLWDLWQPSVIYPLRWRPDFMNLGGPTMDVAWTVWDRRRAGNGTRYVPLDKPEPIISDVFPLQLNLDDLFKKGN